MTACLSSVCSVSTNNILLSLAVISIDIDREKERVRVWIEVGEVGGAN